jgi:hypothetical protein
MSCISKLCLLFPIVMAASFNGQAEATSPGEAARSPRITVRFFNYAQLSANTLNEARDRVTAIYHRTGLAIDWVECPVGGQDPSGFPACTEVLDTTHLFLHLLPQASKMTKLERAGEALLGARMANIYWNRVCQQPAWLQVEPERILAHTIAHEVGHLLLGSNSHSPTGIMAGKWNREELIIIPHFGLSFTTQQSQFIRAEVQRRISQSGGQSHAGPKLITEGNQPDSRSE